jgi:excisionase family DNA binding protein
LKQAKQGDQVLTLVEAAAFLRLPDDEVAAMINARTLPGVRVGADYRIYRASMLAWLNGGHVVSMTSSSKPPPLLQPTQLSFQKDKPFKYRWPNDFDEAYSEAYSTTVGNDEVKVIRIGFCERESGGRLRKRALVLLDGYPTVEFTGANDFNKSRLMAGIIKMADKKQVHPSQGVPPEYQGFRVEPYNEHVIGPRCSQHLAVICKKIDLEVMANHALIRRRLKADASIA